MTNIKSDLNKHSNKDKEENFNTKYDLPDPVCLNKWSWSTIQMSVGQSMSCHRVGGDKITPENYADFHNTPSKLHDRKRMLEGKWPDSDGPNPLRPHWGCEVCREIEDAGGISERKMVNSSFQNFEKLVPKETRENRNSIKTTPTTLEIFFNNQCNLACIYCGPKFSSVIAAECKKFGLNKRTVQSVNDFRSDYNDLLEAHFDWMKENAKSLVKYNILGGEPFIQPELDQNIDLFMDNPCPDLAVKIFTNLNIDNDKLREKLEKIKYLIVNKHLKHISIFCSFDCWGPQIEYIRSGLNLKKWEENFLTILTEYPEIDLLIHSTLTALTFPTFPELVERIKYWNLFAPVKHSISTVDSKGYLHPGILPENFYKKEIQEAVEGYEKIIELTRKVDYSCKKARNEKAYLVGYYRNLIDQLRGYEKTFNNHKVDQETIDELKSYLDSIDSMRGCNWKPLWPWLQNLEV